MKRRSFLQAVGGAIAAVFAPVVAAKTGRAGRFYSGSGPSVVRWSETNSDDWGITTSYPETLAELRAAIESRYETVHEFKQTPYEYEKLFISGAKDAPNAQPAGIVGHFYRGYVIAGEGVNEKEAVANAFNGITWGIGGKEMMWRVAPRLNGHHDFASNRSWVDVRARVIVLR